jgi:hypothetical protein
LCRCAGFNDNFGCSVAISGNDVVVGAFGDDAYNGSAFVFSVGATLLSLAYNRPLTL